MTVLRRQVPRVILADEFLGDEECDLLINAAKPGMANARVANGQLQTKTRNTRHTWLPHSTPLSDPSITLIVQRVARLVGLPVSHAESMQVDDGLLAGVTICNWSIVLFVPLI